MKDQQNIELEEYKEESESYSDDSLYNITSFGSDMMFSQIITMYKDGDLEKPELQRKYVWTKTEASRFIDSILLGLPVPSIFLAKTEDNRLLIVDGYQRIMTVFDYMEQQIFSGDDGVFKLSKSDVINLEWQGKSYAELSDAQKRAIRTYNIHAIIFEQKQPQNDTGMYQIFERINTGGRTLKPQEIRNCVYHGNYNKLLMRLNKTEIWRKILGTNTEDSRMADVELILRFFAFNDIANRPEYNQFQINLVKYLNEYMKSESNISDEDSNKCKKQFLTVMEFLYSAIGKSLFRTGKIKKEQITWAQKINPVVFDAVCTATVLALPQLNQTDYLNGKMIKKYEELIFDDAFVSITKQRTTNVDNIKKRVSIAAKVLYGIKV